MQMRMCKSKSWCAKEQKNKNKYGDEVGSWLDGLFTDGLCTAANIQSIYILYVGGIEDLHCTVGDHYAVLIL